MKLVDRKLVLSCLRLLLKPVAGFCLRNSIAVQEIIECLKQTLIEAAEKQIRADNKKPTDSRLSVMTGIHRRDVARIARTEPTDPAAKNLIMKIVGQWQTAEAFTTAAGSPRVLTFGFDGSEFHKLVNSVSRDLNPATVLFELERVGALEQTRTGVKLVTHNYIPRGDAEAFFKIASDDQSDLTASVEENAFDPAEVPNHHLRTEYDKVRAAAAPEIRQWLLKEGHDFHLRARNFIAQFDQDVNPQGDKKTRTMKVVLGSFGRTEMK